MKLDLTGREAKIWGIVIVVLALILAAAFGDNGFFFSGFGVGVESQPPNSP